MSRHRVLLVDDHQLLREALRRNLEACDFDIVGEASDGPSSVALALERRPDLILMDITMPGGDGISATRSIMRADGRQRVLVLSMHTDARTIREAINAGAVGYIDKSSSIDEVVELMNQILGGDVSLSPRVAEAMLRVVDDTPDHDLSERELEVLRVVATGCSTPEVAQRLFISQKTVKNHLAAIYAKLDARDRTEAVVKAIRMGVVRIDDSDQ
jgi:DNA-binding NarL/FixJ family response regulator